MFTCRCRCRRRQRRHFAARGSHLLHDLVLVLIVQAGDQADLRWWGEAGQEPSVWMGVW